MLWNNTAIFVCVQWAWLVVWSVGAGVDRLVAAQTRAAHQCPGGLAPVQEHHLTGGWGSDGTKEKVNRRVNFPFFPFSFTQTTWSNLVVTCGRCASSLFLKDLIQMLISEWLWWYFTLLEVHPWPVNGLIKLKNQNMHLSKMFRRGGMRIG